MEWVIIHPFGYSRRTEYVETILKEQNRNYINLCSDYSHVKKQKMISNDEKDENVEWIRTIPYEKNISIKRIVSHIHFSVKALIYIRKTNPKYVYCRIPPNILLFLISRFFRKGVLILDIYDLWPESFPKSQTKLIKMVFKVWRYLRDTAINNSKIVVLECNYYEKFLPPIDKEKRITIYPVSVSNETYTPRIECQTDIEESIHLCYLGTINNIVDIDSMNYLFNLISREKMFSVHFIGQGEKKEYLKDSVKKNGGEFIDYGPIFSDYEKNKIINKCHFGLNLFDKRTVIGLSLKSIEYLKFGLPIISNLQGDTLSFIDNDMIGLNYSNIDSIKNIVDFYQKNSDIRQNIRDFYLRRFSNEVVKEKWEYVLRRAEK